MSASLDAAVDATLDVVDEVTRLTVELATIRDTHARELQSVAEAVREACAKPFDIVHVSGTRTRTKISESIRAVPTDDIVARVLGGGR